jgi:hypothetical protein
MKAVRSHIDDLLSKISEVESRSNELVEIQVEKERVAFISAYGGVKSDHHSAVEYWPVWEPKVREEAIGIIRAKIDEFQTVLTDRRRELERMHLDQLSIRDRWSELRGRLHPERYEESGAWWGSMVRAGKDSLLSDYLNGIPEMLPLSESQISQIRSNQILSTSRGLSRIHLNTTTVLSMDVSSSKENNQVPWSILRSVCLDLLKELSLVIERKNVFSPVVIASVNIIDITLRLLYCRDMTQFDEEEQTISRQISEARREAEECASKLDPAKLNPGLDAVVARFTADEKPECVQAAIRKVMEDAKYRNTNRRDDCMQTVITLQSKLNTLLAYRQTNFETPWDSVWTAWRAIVGSEPGMDPPPLQYKQSS